MKTINDIEREYESYTLKSDYVKNIEDFALFIEIGINDTDEQIKDILQEIKENYKEARKAKISNFFLGAFIIREVDYYTEDNKLLEGIVEYILSYKEYFERISSIVTKDNFKELTKLVDFSCEYFNQHIDYFESKRDSLELSYRGINLNSNKINEITVFEEFMNRKLDTYGNIKAVEKTKKMC